MRALPTASLVLFAVLAHPLASARAGVFRVEPVRVILPHGQKTTAVEVTNDGAAPLRIQVDAFTWVQSPTGEMQLSPSADFLFYPKILTLKPGARRKVRIGLRSQGAAGREKSYRMMLEELPGAPNPGKGVQVRLKVGLPIFVEPAAPRADVRLVDVRAGSGKLRFALRAAGTVHAVVEQVSVRALDAKGAEVSQIPGPVGYVLAGGDRRYELPLPPGCGDRVRELKIELRTNRGPLSLRVPLDPAACSP